MLSGKRQSVQSKQLIRCECRIVIFVCLLAFPEHLSEQVQHAAGGQLAGTDVAPLVDSGSILVLVLFDLHTDIGRCLCNGTRDHIPNTTSSQLSFVGEHVHESS